MSFFGVSVRQRPFENSHTTTSPSRDSPAIHRPSRENRCVVQRERERGLLPGLEIADSRVLQRALVNRRIDGEARREGPPRPETGA